MENVVIIFHNKSGIFAHITTAIGASSLKEAAEDIC
jgi:hypothetical protein